MRDIPFSNCEKEFILQCIEGRKRLDGRECYDYRRTKIAFGVDRGCCQVELGKTRVLAQVSCEMTPPKLTRLTEGILFIHVELSPMAAPQFEFGRHSEVGTELTRVLERCIKESRCLDTESLCIMAGLHVWTIRLDIHILNHHGNLIDCASVAAMAAMAHFRRPDVTVSGEDVTVHSVEDRDPVPLSIHHMPLCVTMAFFQQGHYLLVDPCEEEEKVMDGKLIIGMNKHREICTFQLTGTMLLAREQVLRCSNISVVKVAEMTDLIHKALENDAKARSAGEKFGFAESVDTARVTSSTKLGEPVDMEEVEQKTRDANLDSEGEDGDGDEDDMESEPAPGPSKENGAKVKVLGSGAGAIGLGGTSTWQDSDADEDMVEELLQEEAVMKEKEAPNGDKKIKTEPDGDKQHKGAPDGVKKSAEVVNLDSDSEEEAVVMMEPEQMDTPSKSKSKKKSKGKKASPKSSQIDLTKAVKKSSKKS